MPKALKNSRKQPAARTMPKQTAKPDNKLTKEPKRPRSAFLYFCSEKREEVKKQHPSMKLGDTQKALGEMWRNMSEAEKTPYTKLAVTDRKRYEDEKADKSGSNKKIEDGEEFEEE
ncbi:9030_t:CDS:2 [Paraglomus occultum]|uniref:9030_t:CDS:1 n=1 Tax=Paraglomus occultum TaxID=144539 RepID=A0A9N9D655_9GLOM|nr:9030_t:CDS:2 [Paraglomus occultum]